MGQLLQYCPFYCRTESYTLANIYGQSIPLGPLGIILSSKSFPSAARSERTGSEMCRPGAHELKTDGFVRHKYPSNPGFESCA